MGITIQQLFTFLSPGFEVSSFSLGSHLLCACIEASGFRPLYSSSKSSPLQPQGFIPRAIERTRNLQLGGNTRCSWGPKPTLTWHSVKAQVPGLSDAWPIECLQTFQSVSTCFIKTGFVPFIPQRLCSYCSLLKLPMQGAIIRPAYIHEWPVLNRNIQVEINNQSLS